MDHGSTTRTGTVIYNSRTGIGTGTVIGGGYWNNTTAILCSSEAQLNKYSLRLCIKSNHTRMILKILILKDEVTSDHCNERKKMEIMYLPAMANLSNR